MLDQIHTENILFIDTETVPQYPDYKSTPEQYKYLWEKKSSYFRKEDESAGDIYARAGIYAEFGKIICISMGIFDTGNKEKKLRIKSLWGEDEHRILTEFLELFNSLPQKKKYTLCAHNGKEFDFPYIARRLLINNLKLPDILNIAGKKPWETNLIDTMELWKFGDYKHYTSLELLTSVFNISNPKDEIDGSMVADLFWNRKDFESIVKYCEKDVIAIAQLFLRYKGEEVLSPGNIIHIEN